MSLPLNKISPLFVLTSFIIAFASVDLPHPDSPAKDKISPRLTSRLTPFTARIVSSLPVIPFFEVYSTYKLSVSNKDLSEF